MSSTDAAPGIAVLHRDGRLIAVHKPAGMPVQPDRSGDPDLLSAVQAVCGGRAWPVHRIDRPVGGVVLFALDEGSAAALSALFRGRRVEKRYWAIVEGRMESGTLAHALQPDVRARKARTNTAGGRPVHATVSALAHGDRYTLVEVVPDGGAFHQVRAQLAAAGHPIKGDVKYGARRGRRGRIELHARALAFVHPFTASPMCIAAPPPGEPPWPALLAMVDAAP
jgi:23S rRNA pseudouridine1911/1915/1917 synthase